MKVSILVAMLATLLLGACSTREVTKETVIEKPDSTAVQGPQGPQGPPGPSGNTTIIVPGSGSTGSGSGSSSQ